jgi:hypothetical protein
VSARGLEDVRRVLNLQSVRNTTAERRRLENEIRLHVRRLIRELEGLYIDRLESISSSAINLTFDRLEQLQQRVLDVSRRALENHQPGSVLAEELLLFREGLGESLVDFQKNLESGILRLIRDLIRSSRIRGAYGNSIEVLVNSIKERVTQRVESIRDLFNRNRDYLRNELGDDAPSSSTATTSCRYDGQFGCRNGPCISFNAVCNSRLDCSDGSDEDQYYLLISRQSQVISLCIAYQNSTSSCSSGQFQCRNGRCINESNVCDGLGDCYDFSDEDPTFFNLRPSSSYSTRCTICDSLQFQCRNKRCININSVCDNVDHCGDGSDEDVSYFSQKPSIFHSRKCRRN